MSITQKKAISRSPLLLIICVLKIIHLLNLWLFRLFGVAQFLCLNFIIAGRFSMPFNLKNNIQIAACPSFSASQQTKDFIIFVILMTPKPIIPNNMIENYY